MLNLGFENLNDDLIEGNESIIGIVTTDISMLIKRKSSLDQIYKQQLKSWKREYKGFYNKPLPDAQMAQLEKIFILPLELKMFLTTIGDIEYESFETSFIKDIGDSLQMTELLRIPRNGILIKSDDEFYTFYYCDHGVVADVPTGGHDKNICFLPSHRIGNGLILEYFDNRLNDIQSSL